MDVISSDVDQQQTILVEPFIITSHFILKLLDTYGMLNIGECCQAVFNSKIKLYI